jgi:hypothetical protein
MQDQNPKMYRRLRDSGELDRFVNLKAQEASRLYQDILSQGPQPPTLMSEREAEERVKAMMFEFPDNDGIPLPVGDDAASEPEDVPSASEQRRYSVKSDLPFIMMGGPNPYGTLESLEQYLAELQAMPDFDPKALLVEQTNWFIARKERLEAERKTQECGGRKSSPAAAPVWIDQYTPTQHLKMADLLEKKAGAERDPKKSKKQADMAYG